MKVGDEVAYIRNGFHTSKIKNKKPTDKNTRQNDLYILVDGITIEEWRLISSPVAKIKEEINGLERYIKSIYRDKPIAKQKCNEQITINAYEDCLKWLREE